MSSSDPSKPVPLSILAEDPEAEIFLIDGAYRLTDRGLGSLRGEYVPGLYKVKVQTGSRIRERFVRLEAGNEQLVGSESGATLTRNDGVAELRFERLRFATAVPLEGTSWSRDEHTEAAVTHSRQVHVRLGQGSQIFVFTRTWTHAPTPGHPLKEIDFKLSLHALDGTRLVDLVAQGARDDDLEDPWAACTVELNPGLYLLRVGGQAGFDLDQVVVASAGWQTQVFLCELRGRAAATHASIHLRRPEQGFDPGSPGLRLTELTRIGLRNRRAVITPELLKELKDTEDRNPMLGLYGAHLLLMSDEPDLELVRKVVRHLRSLLGAGTHPDVEALALHLGEPLPEPERRPSLARRLRRLLGREKRPDGEGGPLVGPDLFRVPPMLVRSWALVVRETARRPELIPRGSLAAAIADRLWGEGALLIWKALQPGVMAAAVHSEPRAPVEVEALARRLQAVPVESLRNLREASALERALIAHLSGGKLTPVTGHVAQPGSARRAMEAPEPAVERMVKVLGVPAATLEATLLRLLAKLERPTRPGAETLAHAPA